MVQLMIKHVVLDEARLVSRRASQAIDPRCSLWIRATTLIREAFSKSRGLWRHDVVPGDERVVEHVLLEDGFVVVDLAEGVNHQIGLNYRLLRLVA